MHAMSIAPNIKPHIALEQAQSAYCKLKPVHDRLEALNRKLEKTSSIPEWQLVDQEFQKSLKEWDALTTEWLEATRQHIAAVCNNRRHL